MFVYLSIEKENSRTLVIINNKLRMLVISGADRGGNGMEQSTQQTSRVSVFNFDFFSF